MVWFNEVMDVREESTPPLRSYVKVGVREAMEIFPDFLVVGPQRTGTSWLHYNLAHHPQVFMPDKKELYFFNLLNKPNHPKYRSSELEWYLKHFRPGIVRSMRNQVWCMARWGRRYSIRARGEATASYAAMEEELIDEITRLRPDVKVVIMVRNPVARGWSHAVKDLVKRQRRRVEDVTEEEWIQFFTDPYQLACGRFSRIIDNWTERLGSEQVFIGRFEDIATTPTSLLNDLFRFLDVDTEEALMSGAHAQVNAGVKDAVPETLRGQLHELFSGEIRELEKRFGWGYQA